MDKQQNVEERPGDAERPRECGVTAPNRGGRTFRQRQTAAVLRLSRGEDLDPVFRSLGVTARDAQRLAQRVPVRRRVGS